MTNLERLKMELGYKEYCSEADFCTLLKENNLVPSEQYTKVDNQRNLLLTVLDVLNILINDIDLYRKLTDEVSGFSTTQAYSQLSKRIEVLKEQIESIPLPEEEYSNVTLFFTRRR